jgi:peptide/nickel transport system permease protein
MAKYIAQRLVLMVFTIFIVSIVVFLLVRLKGDPVDVMAPPYFSEEQRDAMRRAWGLDKPLAEQYIIFLQNAIKGDFGTSVAFKTDAMALVLERLKWTYLLAATSAVLAVLISIPLGVISALRRGSALDLLVTFGATIGMAMPSFWIGIVLILIFSAHFRLLPAFGALESKSIILPALTLALGMAANLSRLTRSAMLEVISLPYITTARAKGLFERTVVMRHAIRNALIPVITGIGLQLGWLLGGAVIIEVVFAWPGLGRLMVDAITLHKDIAVVQAGLLWFSLSFLMINLVVDLLYTLLDPRIRYS